MIVMEKETGLIVFVKANKQYPCSELILIYDMPKGIMLFPRYIF